MQYHEADSEESLLGLGILPNNQRTWFEYTSVVPETRDQYTPDEVLFSVKIKLENEVVHHKRSVYTSLDLLGDIGGLLDALKSISSVIVTLYFSIFGNPMHEYLLKALFLSNPKSNSTTEKLTTGKD